MDAVQDVAESVLDAALPAIQRHGDDPQIDIILSAGLALAVEQLSEELPDVRIIVRQLLVEDWPRRTLMRGVE